MRLLILLLFSSTLTFAQQNPYATLTYDSLVIYDFDWRSKDGRITSIYRNGKLASTIKKSVTLPAKEAQELSIKIGSTKSYGNITAACFDPHFGMVYYENGKVKEYITICLACNYPRPSLEIPARDQGAEEYEGEVYYTRTGFSKSFRTYLNNLKKKYDFSALMTKSDMFD